MTLKVNIYIALKSLFINLQRWMKGPFAENKIYIILSLQN